MTSVRLLNGEDVLLHECKTVDDVKVKVAIKFGSFAPDVAIFCRGTGTELGNTDDDLPTALTAVLRNNTTYDKSTWKDAIWLHAYFNDTLGVGKAMEAIDRDVTLATAERAALDADDRVVTVSSTYAGEVLLERIEKMCLYPLAEPQPQSSIIGALNTLVQHAHASMDILNREGANALLIATRGRLSCSLISLLLDAHSEVNITDNNGRSPLMVASEYGDAEIVRCLLSAGAHVNTMQQGGSWRTSLSRAAGGHHLQVVDLLLEARANVHAQCLHFGWTCLHYACATGAQDEGACMKRLVEECCEGMKKNAASDHGRNTRLDVNGVDYKGCTPLLIASKHDFMDP